MCTLSNFPFSSCTLYFLTRSCTSLCLLAHIPNLKLYFFPPVAQYTFVVAYTYTHLQHDNGISLPHFHFSEQQSTIFLLICVGREYRVRAYNHPLYVPFWSTSFFLEQKKLFSLSIKCQFVSSIFPSNVCSFMYLSACRE